MPLAARAREHSFPIRRSLGQPARLPIIAFDFVGCVASCRKQCRSERELECQFLPISLFACRQLRHQVQAVSVAQSSLVVGDAVHGSGAGAAPPFDCGLRQPRPREVMRYDPRLAFGPLWKSIAEAFGDPLMQLVPAALEKRRIGCLLDKRMLERIVTSEGVLWPKISPAAIN